MTPPAKNYADPSWSPDSYTAAASAKVKAGRAATLKLRFTPKARRAIKKALKHGRVTATVTVTSGAARATRAITLKR